MRVKVQETPTGLRRRVTEKLESVRGTAMALAGDIAYIGDEVCPIYRPDMTEVAYWEFEILGLKGTQARQHEGRSSGSGFLLASAGKHDVPIPHWSITSEPPSRALESMGGQGKVARVVKLDSLAYAAEDAKGNYLTHLGQFPVRISGRVTSPAVLQGISTVTATQDKPSKDDAKADELKISRSGADVPKLALAAWKTWAEVKRSYSKTYQPHLAALVAHAAPMWEIENLITQFGEGIHEGQKLAVPLLMAGKASITGDGAKFVKLTMVDRKPPAAVLEASSPKAQGEVSFQLVLSYEDRTTETLQFFIIPKDSPSNNRNVLPHLMPHLAAEIQP